MPKRIRDALSLEYHLQLEAMRAGVGSLMAIQILMRVAMATKMLGELGYGKSADRTVADYEGPATDAFTAGCEGRYAFDAATVQIFASLLTEHDAQLEIAPVRVIDQIAGRLERSN
ncbi:Fis family transcriptional regulator [Paraburkholderia kururiensis]|uniref:Fis family transcriptional regulator n=1 Tax=Paraburkholderia kururiensis TaxID=984307 RepID=UPI0020D18854|nr:Fis family transcriptional regulator [Paraburkholderia kururiensis]